MMKKLILVMVLVLAILAIQAGNATLHSDQRPENVERPQFGERPKLVVGITPSVRGTSKVGSWYRSRPDALGLSVKVL